MVSAGAFIPSLICFFLLIRLNSSEENKNKLIHILRLKRSNGGKTSKCTCPLLNTSINNKQIDGLSVTVTE